MGYLLSLVESPLVLPVVAVGVVHDGGGHDGGVVLQALVSEGHEEAADVGVLIAKRTGAALDLDE